MARPYAYARFGLDDFDCLRIDRDIQLKRRQYDQPSDTMDSYSKMNESLIDITNIMRKNIDEVVQRVEKLDRESGIFSRL